MKTIVVEGAVSKRALLLSALCGCRCPRVHFGVARVQLEIEAERVDKESAEH